MQIDRTQPGAGQPLWALTATELAAAFGRGETTPSAVLEAVLARHDAVNPQINAVIVLDRAGATLAAAESTARWKKGAPIGPLDGIPITVKDNINVAGLPSRWGSALYADHVPERDETPVARLRAAGAVILGKTNVPEFTVHGITDNALFGPTRNPWNLAVTPGGSSGGAVAAVAAGIGPLALCTDGGGSIRRPAGHTGLVGFKPSRGLVPRAGGFPTILNDCEVAGPVGRTLADVAAMLQAIADGETGPYTLPATLRVGYLPTFAQAPVDPQIAASVAAAAARFSAQGHEVERLDDFVMAEPIAAIWPVLSETGVAWLVDRHPGRESEVGPHLQAMARRGRGHSASDYLDMLMTIRAVDDAFAGLFSRYDLLLLPATAAQPWPIGVSHPETIDGQPVGPRGHAVFTAFANALGLPAISVPGRPDAGGMPIGIQLCAPRGQDALVLAAAEILTSDGTAMRPSETLPLTRRA